MTAKLPEAYRFASSLTLDEMLAALNAAGPWDWTARDSETHGDYLIARPDAGPTRLRILQVSGAGFLLAIDMSVRPEKRKISRVEIDRIVHERVLPAVAARAVTRAEGA